MNWTAFRDLFNQPDFWKFTAKDLLTAGIALAALVGTAVNIWVSYLRRHNLRCDVSDDLRMGYGPNPTHFLMFKIDVFALNKGARPGVITRMAIELTHDHSTSLLRWTENTQTTNVAEKGKPRSVLIEFASFASPVLVPKYDSRLIGTSFWASATEDLLPNTDYQFRLVYWADGRKRPFKGRERAFKLNLRQIEFLGSKATASSDAVTPRVLHLTSTDGKSFDDPISVEAFAFLQWLRTADAAKSITPPEFPPIDRPRAEAELEKSQRTTWR